MFSADDTIVAIATPPGRGGIGVVRLSGPEAVRIARGLVDRDEPFEPRRATFARILAPAAAASSAGPQVLDHVVVTCFEAPHSYTGEDVVEVSGHGSPVLLEAIVRMCLADGARLAEPGEFTLRAHLNGRLDLVQAEAVADLVDAVTPRQARAAMDQLEGTLTGAITAVDAALLDLTARLEASLDFPDEGFHFIAGGEAAAVVAQLRDRLAALAVAGHQGRLVREGALVVIAGLPNAGKSSLFNALVGAARAIVTDEAGTTRDVLSEQVDIGGVPVTLVDTAGIREAANAIEAEGVARARQAQTIAALTLVVVDGSTVAGDAERGLLRDVPRPRLIVISKEDLPTRTDAAGLGVDEAHVVSTVTGEGLEALRGGIIEALGAVAEHDVRESPALTNARHVALVERARDALDRAVVAIAAGATEELVLVELTAARVALEELTGARNSDDLLAHVFARFCVGK